MADQNEYLIGQPEISEQLMRALFLKGDLPQFVQGPYGLGVQVLDLTTPEYFHLRRWRRYMGRAAQAAVAANFSILVFGTPNVGREVMAVVEQIWVRANGAAGPIRFGINGDVFALGATAPASIGFGAQDDRSLPAGAWSSTYGMSFINNAASPLSAADPEIVSGGTNTVFVPIDPTRPLILTNKPINNTAKSYLYVVPTAVNFGIDVCVFWRERSLLETEL